MYWWHLVMALNHCSDACRDLSPSKSFGSKDNENTLLKLRKGRLYTLRKPWNTNPAKRPSAASLYFMWSLQYCYFMWSLGPGILLFYVILAILLFYVILAILLFYVILAILLFYVILAILLFSVILVILLFYVILAILLFYVIIAILVFYMILGLGVMWFYVILGILLCLQENIGIKPLLSGLDNILCHPCNIAMCTSLCMLISILNAVLIPHYSPACSVHNTVHLQVHRQSTHHSSPSWFTCSLGGLSCEGRQKAAAGSQDNMQHAGKQHETRPTSNHAKSTTVAWHMSHTRRLRSQCDHQGLYNHWITKLHNFSLSVLGPKLFIPITTFRSRSKVNYSMNNSSSLSDQQCYVWVLHHFYAEYFSK